MGMGLDSGDWLLALMPSGSLWNVKHNVKYGLVTDDRRSGECEDEESGMAMTEREFLHELLFYLEASRDWCELWYHTFCETDVECAEYEGRLATLRVLGNMVAEHTDEEFMAEHYRMPPPHHLREDDDCPRGDR